MAPDESGFRREPQLKRAFDVCVAKTRNNIKRLADEPKSAAWALDGDYFRFAEGFFEIGNWTSSFFTGMALLAWRETEDEYFLNQVLRLAPAYREKATTRCLDMHHDAGFLYSLYSVALYRLTGDAAHREVGLAAAEALYQRFNHTGGFIRAWGRLDTSEHDNMAIIDCMMNLPLLYWASLETGDGKYRAAAIRQADTSLKCFVRPDDSLFHAFRFDLKTGAPIGGDNYCGKATDSYWARGATWAIYGFAMSHRYTGDGKYLEASLRLARKFISQLDDHVVPVWDFRLPPDAPRVRDASAAAIAVCGFQELQRLNAADELILKTKDAFLNRLCSEDYLDADPACRGVLKSAFGDRPAYSSWGDYFLMEALAREQFRVEPWW
ncbi:MAG TPA: glycoside hydrolase family 88 protein [Candidatus Paceibacterota bacterium]|nr:glycoside hydrolase family 88 protein [Candidatus Paceibacterota bacterium]